MFYQNMQQAPSGFRQTFFARCVARDTLAFHICLNFDRTLLWCSRQK